MFFVLIFILVFQFLFLSFICNNNNNFDEYLASGCKGMNGHEWGGWLSVWLTPLMVRSVDFWYAGDSDDYHDGHVDDEYVRWMWLKYLQFFFFFFFAIASTIVFPFFTVFSLFLHCFLLFSSFGFWFFLFFFLCFSRFYESTTLVWPTSSCLVFKILYSLAVRLLTVGSFFFFFFLLFCDDSV